MMLPNFYKIQICIILFMTPAVLFAQKDYTLHINDSVYVLALDEEKTYTINGKPARVTVKLNDILTYTDKHFSFSYPKEYKISKTSIDEGTEQIMLVSAEGSGFIIQQFLNINPISLTSLMLSELTKESKSYGYVSNTVNSSKKIASGQLIEVTKETLTYKDEVNIYEVGSIGNKDEGIIVISMIMSDVKNEQGKKLIDMMWDTLKYF